MTLRIVFFNLVLVILVLVFAKPVFAAQNFAADYDVTVAVAPSGKAHVTQNITITNLQNGVFAREYSLTLASIKPANMRAYSKFGPIQVTMSQQGDKTKIQAILNQKVIGVDKNFPFTLEYDIDNFVLTQGKVRSFSVPRVAITEELQSYQLHITVPKQFGAPSIVSPRPKSQRENYSTIMLEFDKDSLANESVSVLFGDRQYYELKLQYAVPNPNLVAIEKEVLLVPSNAYQKVYVESIDPQPKAVRVDADGNWIATFRIDRAQKLNVLLRERVVVFTKPQYQESQSQNQLQDYLQGNQYWQSDDPKILSLTEQLQKAIDRGPVSSPAANTAKTIFQYVVGTLVYDNTTQGGTLTQRVGAVKAIENRDRANDLGFADSFVTLARAMKLPAREVVGFVSVGPLTQQNQGSNYQLHVWAEYYNKDTKNWLYVDPLYTAVTGGANYVSSWDLSHIAFITWGLDPKDPFPSSLTALTERTNEPILVVTEPFNMPEPSVRISAVAVTPGLILAPSRGNIKIENKGNVAINQATVSLATDGFNIVSANNSYTISVLPPGGSITIPFTYQTKHFLQFVSNTVTVRINTKDYLVPISPSPLTNRLKSLILLPAFAGGLIGMLVVYLLKRRSMRKVAQPKLPKKKLNS